MIMTLEIISIILSAANLLVYVGMFVIALLTYLNNRENKHK